MNNLEKAKRALSGKKRFLVRMERSTTWEYEVEASDKQAANDLAWKEHNDGDRDGDEGDTEIYETEELNN